MNVKLIAHSVPNMGGNPERVIAAAAKLCYASTDAETIMEGLTPEKTEGFLDMLTEIGHASPIEHAVFTFAIEGVSRSLLAQITRHRIASFSVQSQRYVKLKEGIFTFITPPEIAKDPIANEKYQKAMEDCHRNYLELAETLQERHLESLMNQGIPAKEAMRRAEKMAIEDARYVLPNACETKMVVTMNARSLYNFFSLRCCNRAQWEIRELAWQMLKLCREVSPVLFKKAGPSCLNGACPEGKMTCGKAAEMRNRSEHLMEGGDDK